MANSPTSRTLKALRIMGYTAAVTEHWNGFAHLRQDLFGFIDILAIRADKPGVLGVQCTTDSNMAARSGKIQDLPAAKVFTQAGNKIWVVGWAKHGPRGKAKHWQMKTILVAGWHDDRIMIEDISGRETCGRSEEQ